jgi:hypothetical protein
VSMAQEPAKAPQKQPLSPVQSGELTPSTLPSLIHSLFASHATGLLTLRDGELQKTVYVQAGNLVFAQSTDPDDRLGEMLIRKGVLSIRGLEHYSHEVMNAGRRLGGFLIERGLITPVELIDGVQDQVREIIISLFDWTRGEYSFRRGPLPTREVITLEMNTLEILWNGMHSIQTWSRIKQAVGGLSCVYQAVEGAQEKLNLPVSDRDANLLRFCVNPVSVGEICDTLPGNNFELCRTIWAFHVTEAMTRVE